MRPKPTIRCPHCKRAIGPDALAQGLGRAGGRRRTARQAKARSRNLAKARFRLKSKRGGMLIYIREINRSFPSLAEAARWLCSRNGRWAAERMGLANLAESTVKVRLGRVMRERKDAARLRFERSLVAGRPARALEEIRPGGAAAVAPKAFEEEWGDEGGEGGKEKKGGS